MLFGGSMERIQMEWNQRVMEWNGLNRMESNEWNNGIECSIRMEWNEWNVRWNRIIRGI